MHLYLLSWHVIFFFYSSSQLCHLSFSVFWNKLHETETVYNEIPELVLVSRFITTYFCYFLYRISKFTPSYNCYSDHFYVDIDLLYARNDWASHHLEPLHVPLFYHRSTFRDTLQSFMDNLEMLRN